MATLGVGGACPPTCRSRPCILAVAERLLQHAGVQKKELLPTKQEDGRLVQYTVTSAYGCRL